MTFSISDVRTSVHPYKEEQSSTCFSSVIRINSKWTEGLNINLKLWNSYLKKQNNNKIFQNFWMDEIILNKSLKIKKKIRNKQKCYRKAQSIWKTKETTNRTAENTSKCMSDKGPRLEI